MKSWLQEYQVYKTKICKLERELHYSFDDSELQEFYDILLSLKKKISKLKELSSYSDAKYIERIKILMEQIESEILSIKKKNREEYEMINREEKNLTREIDSMREIIDSWTTTPIATLIPSTTPIPISLPHKSNLISKSNAIPNEVVEYEDFLKKNGGITGGWDQQDHNSFLKMYSKYKENEQMIITQLLKLLPHYDIFSIQEHLQFYKSLQQYTLKRKNAIQLWKKEKQMEREEMIHEKEEEEEQVLQLRVEDKIKQELIQKEKERRKKELKEWKQAKLNQREETKKQEDEKEIMKKKEEMREMQWKREQMKIKLEEYKKKKQESSSEEEEEEKEEISLEQLERIRLKNVEYLHRKKLLKELKEPKPREITITPTVTAERDFSRLISPTESHNAKLIQRVVEKDQPTTHKQTSLFILKTQHRAIPNWRK